MTSDLARAASVEFLQGGRSGDQETSKVKPESILEALDLCLENNVFIFNEKKYLQVGGVGTGVKLAPPYMPVLAWVNMRALHLVQGFTYWRT